MGTLLLFHHLERKAATNFISSDWVGEGLKAHPCHNLEFNEQGLAVWVFVPTWGNDNFSHVAVAV